MRMIILSFSHATSWTVCILAVSTGEGMRHLHCVNTPRGRIPKSLSSHSRRHLIMAPINLLQEEIDAHVLMELASTQVVRREICTH